MVDLDGRDRGRRLSDNWCPDGPSCSRCGRPHAREWLTFVEGERWVGDGCLTAEERGRFCREPEAEPRGKIEVPKWQEVSR